MTEFIKNYGGALIAVVAAILLFGVLFGAFFKIPGVSGKHSILYGIMRGSEDLSEKQVAKKNPGNGSKTFANNAKEHKIPQTKMVTKAGTKNIRLEAGVRYPIENDSRLIKTFIGLFDKSNGKEGTEYALNGPVKTKGKDGKAESDVSVQIIKIMRYADDAEDTDDVIARNDAVADSEDIDYDSWFDVTDQVVHYRSNTAKAKRNDDYILFPETGTYMMRVCVINNDKTLDTMNVFVGAENPEKENPTKTNPESERVP